LGGPIENFINVCIAYVTSYFKRLIGGL
jgi:hypothetical protein